VEVEVTSDSETNRMSAKGSRRSSSYRPQPYPCPSLPLPTPMLTRWPCCVSWRPRAWSARRRSRAPAPTRPPSGRRTLSAARRRGRPPSLNLITSGPCPSQPDRGVHAGPPSLAWVTRGWPARRLLPTAECDPPITHARGRARAGGRSIDCLPPASQPHRQTDCFHVPRMHTCCIGVPSL